MSKPIKIILDIIIAALIFSAFFYFVIDGNNLDKKNNEIEIILNEVVDKEIEVEPESEDVEDIEEVKEPARNATQGDAGGDKNPEMDSTNSINSLQVSLPPEILIKVPFAIQAPFAVWDEYHEEACEEASLIMVAYFLKNKSLTPEISEKEIQAMIKFQIENYGDYKDSSAQELVRLAKDFYGIENLEVIYNFSKDDLKKYLSLGNPIIIPAAGRLLGNPYFKAPGPLYHNLVLIGYNRDKIITNDPGTKRGEGYVYDIDVIYNSIHDFTGKKEDIEKGRKAMIIIK